MRVGILGLAVLSLLFLSVAAAAQPFGEPTLLDAAARLEAAAARANR